MRVLGVYRATRFSPNSVERDASILRAVVDGIPAAHKEMVSEEELTGDEEADVVMTMARSESALSFLSRMERHGAKVLNRPDGVRACVRSALDRVMRKAGVPMPPIDGKKGWWLKRGDASAQCHDDVVFCPDTASLEEAKVRFRERGIKDMVVSAHVDGDLVKFYGVKGTGFFRTYYPNDDGQTKFGDERKNGPAHHYPYEINALQDSAERLSALVDTPIYGGDCIIDPHGGFKIIDFNDWPSFSRCREEAAKAIITIV